MKLDLVLFLIVLFLLGAPSPSRILGQEKDAAPPVAEKAPPKAGKKDQKAAGPLGAKEKSVLRGRMRRQMQSNRVEPLRQSVKTALEQADPQKDRRLYADAAFYKAGLCASDVDDAGFWKWLETAVEHGFLSADNFENLSLIPDRIKGSAQFKSRMEALRKEAEGLIWKDFTESVAGSLSSPSREPFPLPVDSGVGPKKLDPPSLKGRPLCVVVTPIYHDGFEKELEHLEKVAARHGERAGVVVLFYQYEATDGDRREKTGKYIENWLDLELPAAIVARDFVKPLEIPYYPSHFFLNPEGKLAYRSDGYMDERKLDFVLGELVKKSSPPPPPPAREPEKKPEPKAEEEKLPEKKPEPPAEPPSGESVPEKK